MDPLISLALSIHSNKGAYALLLGSGISRPSGIPTGWEITLDMIRKAAVADGQDCGDDPAAWYAKRYNTAPSYSDLLNSVVKSPTERNSFLRPYFEPTAEEREEGKKQPTSAHRLIAKLVTAGYFRVIVTTNFDRLLERAIEDEGITPTVISSPDACDGAVPLIHSKCTVIKVNGDYLDTRIKNTAGELREYDARLNSLLERIFDEFGLLVCGWSGEWDSALKAALERTKGRRYSAFWLCKGNLTQAAEDLIKLRGAVQVDIRTADSFFGSLEEKLSALDELAVHPLSSKLAVVSLKKYLAEDRHKIRLHDLLRHEVGNACAAIVEDKFPLNGVQLSPEYVLDRINKYNTALETVVALITNGCFWSAPPQDELWTKTIERIANSAPTNGGGFTVLISLRLYPALFLFYAAGMTCIAKGNYALLLKLFNEINIKGPNESDSALESLYAQKVLESSYGSQIKQYERHRTPMNDILFQFLRDPMRDLVPDDVEYEELFDRFEYFYSMAYIDKTNSSHDPGQTEAWAPPGRFAWKHRRSSHTSNIISSEMEKQNKFWPPIKAGHFQGSFERATQAKKLLDNFVPKLHWY